MSIKCSKSGVKVEPTDKDTEPSTPDPVGDGPPKSKGRKRKKKREDLYGNGSCLLLLAGGCVLFILLGQLVKAVSFWGISGG